MEKPREIAVRILRRHAEQAEYLENLLEMELAGVPLLPADRRLVQELTYGVVRWQAALDWLIAQKTAGRTQKTALQILLRLGLYQIFWLERIPAHAAVHETVEIAKRLGFGPQAGFINAILRGYLRKQGETEKAIEELKSSQPALGYSHPEWLVERWRERWGEENTRRLLDWNNTPPPAYARLNTLKASPEKLAAQWKEEGVQFVANQCSWAGEGLVFELKSHASLADLPSFQQGLFYIQDPSTLLAVQMLNPQPGETILDLCAAPGGKTTFIAQQMQNTGCIVAQDIWPARLDLVRQNCTRLGVSCAVLLPTPGSWGEGNLPGEMGGALEARPGQEGSGSKSALLDATRAGSGPLEFDRILVDAPCSNTGVMRRRVDLRRRIRPEEFHRLHRAQVDVLNRAADQLKKGGTLVYSTCSLEPEENRQVVDEFLAAHAGFHMEEERALLPFVDGVDGAYVARMSKR